MPLKQLKNLLKTLEEGGAAEFEYEDEKVRLRVSLARGAPLVSAAAVGARAEVPVVAPAPAATADAAGDASIVFITSPFVGTFYRAASPEAEPFAQAGSPVKKGQTLCIVEAMKLMNEIETEFAGTLLEVLVENGQSVEFGQKLFKLKKS
ncbi:MAG: acetyl-CoA carboxylase biotin carboxyl carrier protein [Myxococcales bacterium]|nr:acetyl-CoA carboxylase biotin carboxyl carrier protein [Myxococcales bacterium]